VIVFYTITVDAAPGRLPLRRCESYFEVVEVRIWSGLHFPHSM
jgi:hypothetical protein